METRLFNYPALKLLVPFILGIVCYSYSKETIAPVAWSFVIPLIFLGLIYLSKRPTAKSVLVLFLFFIIGYLHPYYSDPFRHHHHFSKQDEVSALIVQVEKLEEKSKKLRVVSEVRFLKQNSNLWHQSNGKLLLYIKNLNKQQLEIGDYLHLPATYYKVKQNSNPNTFGFKRYLNNLGIDHIAHLDQSDIQILKSNSQTILSAAYMLREHCQAILNAQISNKENLAIASAMILGNKDLIQDELYEAYSDSGAIHVLAVSGLHVGIVASIILLLFRTLGLSRAKKLESVCCIIMIWAFALICGSGPAVVRASIMFSLLLIGRAISRPGNSLNILAVAAFGMLLYDPNFLYQVGFQFSFLALASIIHFFPLLRRVVNTNHKWLNHAWNLVAVSIAAQILIFPLSIYYFHKFPTYFFLSSLIAIPAAFLILATGLGLLLVSTIPIPLLSSIARVLSLVLDQLLTALNWFIYNIQQLPFSHAENLSLSNTSILLIYLVILLAAFYAINHNSKILTALLSLILIQSISRHLENYKLSKEPKLVIYDIYGESYADLFIDCTHVPLHLSINNPKQISYNTSGHQIAQRTRGISSLSDHDIEENEHILLYNDQLILLYPDHNILAKRIDKPIQLAILSAQQELDVRHLLGQFQIEQIILDSSFKKEKYQLQKIITEHGIPVHCTSISGSYTKLL